MKLLIVNGFGQGKVIESNILPRIGDKVDMFYTPHPKVNNVLLYPSKETMKEHELVDAVITVD